MSKGDDERDPRARRGTTRPKTKATRVDETRRFGERSKTHHHHHHHHRLVFAYKRAILRAQREAKRKGKEVERRVRDAFFFFPRGTEEASKKCRDERMMDHHHRRTRNSSEKDYYYSSTWSSILSTFSKRTFVGEKLVDPMKRSAKRLSDEAKENARKLRANLKRKNGSPSSGTSSAANDDDARSKKNETFSDEKNDRRRVRLERERKKMEEKWKEVVEKVKEGTKMTTTTTTSSSSSSSGATTDARKQQQKREDEHKKKKKNTSEENTKREERSLKKKAEKMTKELRLELKENANKLNSAIDASKKEAEAAFASAKDRVMAMTVKKDVVRDGGKNKNTKQEKKKNSTRTSSSSSRDIENKNKKKTTTSETPTTTNIFERSKSVASDFVDTATTSVEDVKGNIETVQKSVAKKIADLHLRENFEGTTQNIARESKKIVTEDLPSTIKTLSKESANLTGSAMKEFNENIDVDLIAQNAKKSIEGTSKTVESLIRDVQSNASLAAASGKAIVTDLIDPPEKMHRVRKGESLLKIARKYDVSVVDVCRVNNLVPTDDNPHFVAIKIGQILNIPNSDRMAEQPAYENSKFDQKFESTVNAYYEQRLLNSSMSTSSSSSSSSSNNNKVAVVQVNNKSTSSGNAKLAGSFALLVTAAAISYLRAGLDDDINDEDENDGNSTIPRDDATNNNTSQML